MIVYRPRWRVTFAGADFSRMWFTFEKVQTVSSPRFCSRIDT